MRRRARTISPCSGKGYTPDKPTFLGTKAFDDYDLGRLVERIDWTPFFRTWELAGNYPKILTDKVVGESATDLFRDAEEMLTKILDEKWLRASGVIGFWPANAIGDDVELYTDDTRTDVKGVAHFLRQQNKRRRGKYNQCLSDFIAPKETGLKDYLGGFCRDSGHRYRRKNRTF